MSDIVGPPGRDGEQGHQGVSITRVLVKEVDGWPHWEFEFYNPAMDVRRLQYVRIPEAVKVR